MNKRISGIALGWLIIVAGGIAQADTTWTNVPTGTAWEHAANWNNGVPYGTAVLRASVLPTGNAQLTNTAASYTVNVNQPATLNDLNIVNAGANATTLNVNTNMTLTGMNEGNPLGQLTTTKAVINVNSNGTLTIGYSAVLNANSVTIAAGGLLIWSEIAANGLVRLDNGPVTVNGTMMGTAGIWGGNAAITVNNGAGANVRLDITGGKVIADNMSIANRGVGTVNITAGGLLVLRNGNAAGELNVGSQNNVANTAVINLTSGILTNNCMLKVARGTTDTRYTNNTETGTVNVNGGTFVQKNVTYIGQSRVGLLSVSSGSFTTTNDVIVGGITTAFLPLGPSVTASGSVNVSGGTLTTGPLRVGDSVVAPGGALALLKVPGSVTLTGGTTTTALLSATNANGTIAFNGGTLLSSATTISNGSIFTVGNGSSAATLGLLTGAHSFANGLTVAANGVLATGGTNAIAAATVTGDVTLQSSAVLDCDFTASTQDATTITGTLTLPASATLRARSLDGARPSVIPVMQATTIAGNATGWNKVQVGANEYRAVVVGNQLQLQRIENGTAIFIR